MFKFISGKPIVAAEKLANAWLREQGEAVQSVSMTAVASGQFWQSRICLCIRTGRNKNQTPHECSLASRCVSGIKLFEGNEWDLEARINDWERSHPNFNVEHTDLAPTMNGEVVVAVTFTVQDQNTSNEG